MALDAYGVSASLAAICPLDGVAGPYAASGTNIYQDGLGAYWRLDFGAAATNTQKQAAITALAALTSYTQPAGLTPYRLNGTLAMSSTLGIGLTTVSCAVQGLLRTDTAMYAFPGSLPAGADVRSGYADPSRDGFYIFQISISSVISGSTTIPFTLIGVR